MKPRGRPSKPDAVKAKQGTLKKIRVRVTPQPPAIGQLPPPPDYLSEVGAAEWVRLIDQLDRMSMLARTDLSALGAACLEWEAYLIHRDLQKRNTAYYAIKDDAGQVKSWQPHPAHYIGNAHLKNYLELCREFGFTPAARTRLGAAKPDEKPQSKAAGLLKAI